MIKVNQYCKKCGKEILGNPSICPECGARLKMRLGFKILTGFGIALLLFILIGIFSTPSSDSQPGNTNLPVSNNIASDTKSIVMYGHLGNFKDTRLDEVLKATYGSVKWDSFTTDNKNIVEATCGKKGEITSKMQFVVTGDTFELVYIDLNGESFSNEDAEAVAEYVNGLYGGYYKSINNPIDPTTPIDETINKGSK